MILKGKIAKELCLMLAFTGIVWINFNSDAQNFNKKLTSTASKLSKQHSDLNLVIFDIYQPFYDLIQNPSKSGFVEARRGCCGTGLVETTSFLCNPKSIGTCRNASQYVF
ncbi:unnamed protein product [Amaranthus hypochondriacus]